MFERLRDSMASLVNEMRMNIKRSSNLACRKVGRNWIINRYSYQLQYSHVDRRCGCLLNGEYWDNVKSSSMVVSCGRVLVRVPVFQFDFILRFKFKFKSSVHRWIGWNHYIICVFRVKPLDSHDPHIELHIASQITLFYYNIFGENLRYMHVNDDRKKKRETLDLFRFLTVCSHYTLYAMISICSLCILF